MEINVELLVESDFETMVIWVNDHDEDFMVQWAGPTFNYPLTLDQIQSHYNKGINSVAADVFIYRINETSSNKIIGSIQLCRFDTLKSEAVIGRFIIGQSAYRGIGIGSTALKKIIQIGFEQFALKKIILNVFDINYPAIRCYQKAGFIKGKITKNVYQSKQGKQWNNIEMILNKENCMAL